MKNACRLIIYGAFLIGMMSCSTSKPHLSKSKPRNSRIVKSSPTTPKRQGQEYSTKNKKYNSDFSVLADDLIGTPYKYGGKSRSGFDCSGLVSYVYKKVGVDLPGSSSMMSKRGKAIRRSDAGPGDLIFFHRNGTVYHVSMVVEKEQEDIWVVHSTSSRGVIKENIFASSYWSSKQYSIRSIINK